MPSTNLISAEQTAKILCCYHNPTARIQIIKILENERYTWKKAVFPQQRVLFESSMKGKIEIYLQQDKQPIHRKVSSYISIQQEEYSKKLVAV